MPSVFPGALDSLTNPSPTSKQDILPHSAQHGNANDAIEAIEATIGITGSTVAGTLEKRLILLESGGIETQSGIFSPWVRGAYGDMTHDDAGAIQSAIDDAYAAGGGSVGPLGKHKCLSAIIRKPNVNIFGHGYGHSWLYFPTDLGAGVAALDYDVVHALGGPVAGYMRDFSVVSGVGSFTLGVQTCNMDGVRPIAHSMLDNVQIYGFRSGLNIHWDHIRVRNCTIANNFYNVLFDHSPATTGNQSFWGCVLVQPAMGSIGIASTHAVDQTLWDGCHLGFGPYGIHRADMGTVSAVQGISNSLFTGTTFELCGNAAILDETTGAGADSIYNTNFERCTYSSSNSSSHRIGARAFDAAVVLRNWRATEVFESHLPFAVPFGGSTIFKPSGIVAGVVDHRPPEGWTGTMPTGADQLVTPGSLNFANGLTVDMGNYKGVVRTAIGTITKGDILQYSTTAGWVTRMSSSGTFAGIALTDAVNAGTVVIAPPGQEVSVTCEPVASGAAIRPVVGTEHRGDDTGSGPIIGYAVGPGGSSGGAATLIATKAT